MGSISPACKSRNTCGILGIYAALDIVWTSGVEIDVSCLGLRLALDSYCRWTLASLASIPHLTVLTRLVLAITMWRLRKGGHEFRAAIAHDLAAPKSESWGEILAERVMVN